MIAAPPRPGAGQTFVRLYRSEQVFRSSVDLAVIGLIVCAFMEVLPSPLAVFGYDQPARPPVVAANPPVITPEAEPERVPLPGEQRSLLNSRWHKLSDASIGSQLDDIARLINLGDRSGAQALLAQITNKDDPNVVFYASLLTVDPRAHMQFVTRAAELGHPSAMINLGGMYRRGQLVEKNASKAVALYERALALGDRDAASCLGSMYLMGDGVRQDAGKAVALLRQAAEDGEPEAMSNLAIAYFRGQGVDPDRKTGMEWMRRAAESGHSAVQYNYAIALSKEAGAAPDFQGVKRWMQASAEQGYLPAIYRLGVLYARPDDGSPPELAKAIEVWKKGAAKNDPRSLAALGTMLEFGKGIEKNDNQALLYYALAAGYGHPRSADRVAVLKRRMAPTEVDKIATTVRGLLGPRSPL